ncbi:MAG: ABC transporter substrate-binding protein [Sulfolobaceae archaeon]|nr:ABC transporter substrate-binding protein [Sulfolobaceae archaeon]
MNKPHVKVVTVPVTSSVVYTSTVVPNITVTTTITKTITNKITITPPNTSQLVDVYWTAAPDALDPGTGFFVQDAPLFSSVYQELVEFNGSSITSVVPVIAQNYTTTNYENWTFYIRHGVYFPDGVRVNASTVWFSLYRTILMGQGPGVANYIGLLFNSTQYAATGYALPWGIGNALHAVLGINASNATLVANTLASILSHFNAANKTIQEIMSYPYQAVVVKGPYEVQINTLEPYRYFIFDIAVWWGAIVDPVFIDQHGGVQPNSPNSYINLHGMPGTGPYIISYVAQGFSEIILKANPNYWAMNASNIPAVAQPAHIPVVIIYYGLSHTDRVEDFDQNIAQISYVSVPFIGQMYSGYKYKGVPLTAILRIIGYDPSVFYLSMSTEVFPTNITDFRLGIEYAINYSALLHIFAFNNTILASEYLGPISNAFPIYNEVMAMDHLTPYTYNLSLAIHYLNEAGYIGHFSLVMPNGTVLGDPSAPELGPIDIYAITPITPLLQEELEIIEASLQQVGISVSVRLVTASVTDQWTTPSSTPAMVMLGWQPDWPDPIYQELIPLTDVQEGGISGNMAWVNISTLQTMYETLPFMTNSTQQLMLVAKVYNTLYNYAPYVWLPNPEVYYFIQPYVQGFEYNPFTGYWYNMIYYSTS